MGDWKQWSEWLREGYYVSYVRNAMRYYEHIILRDLAHYTYEWFEAIESEEESGPHVPGNLVMTVGYNADTNTNRVWQMIFGIRGECYIYIELPTDTHRHGLPKIPKPRPSLRQISHFEEWMSDFNEPTFLTECIMMKPGFDRINFSAYNPTQITLTPQLNFFVNRMITERIGREYLDPATGRLILQPTNEERWGETLTKLYKRQIPHRPLTLLPVRAPEAEE